ncbi:MAG TPA: phosphatase PAP2 family protein [Ktedonobacterales bacterium]
MLGVQKVERKPTATAREELARIISMVVHPVLFPLVALGITLYVRSDDSVGETARDLGLALALTTLPIAVLVGVQVLRGKWTDLDVSVRRQRYALYPFGIACMAALAVSYARLNAPQVAVQSAVALMLANVVNGLVNFVYKVSAHATGAAASAALLWLALPYLSLAVVASIAALLVGWSRVALHRHTRGQVLLGWAVGVASMVAAIRVPLPWGL